MIYLVQHSRFEIGKFCFSFFVCWWNKLREHLNDQVVSLTDLSLILISSALELQGIVYYIVDIEGGADNIWHSKII